MLKGMKWRDEPGERSLTEAPALLLIRVYQDTMAALFKLARILLAQRIGRHSFAQSSRVKNEIAGISSREAEYNRLSRPDAGR